MMRRPTIRSFLVGLATYTVMFGGVLYLTRCKAETAVAAPAPDAVAFLERHSLCNANERCFTLVWVQPSDTIGGKPDAYVVEVAANGAVIATDTVTATIFDVTVGCSPGASGAVTAQLWSLRRGIKSATPATVGQVYSCPDVPPPPPDSVRFEPPPPVVTEPPPPDTTPVALGPGFVDPRPMSPHFDHVRLTFTDFCYCFDGPLGDSLRAWAAREFDLVMSGNAAKWRALNPTIDQYRYILFGTTLDEANSDPNSLTGKFQADMREWYAMHPQYSYESAWLHQKGDSIPADSAHRLNPFVWSTKRFAGNPLDPGWRAYTVDRFKRALAESPGSNGLFLDEMDRANVAWIEKSKEGQGLDSLVWQNAIISLIGDIKAAMPGVEFQSNAAGYSKRDLELRIGQAVGDMHLELMNLATQEQPSVWAMIDKLLAGGTDVDYVGAEMWTDMLVPKWLTKYPGGNYAAPVYRAKVQQLANYYMVVGSDPQHIGLQIESTRGITPDSAALPIYRFNVGHPKGPRSMWLDVRDPLNQRARVYRRDFDNAVILNRPVVYWADTLMTEATATPVPLPEGGPWSYVKARGAIVPLDSLALRNGESVILVRTDSVRS